MDSVLHALARAEGLSLLGDVDHFRIRKKEDKTREKIERGGAVLCRERGRFRRVGRGLVGLSVQIINHRVVLADEI